ncbi:unnamed protein product [Litomosoides sigmodontis]|uniref:Uncharacterized protein n=1 Tax=Litomosoides sigmodontis TaxID=42156 RepID=A0A3P6SES3_LITSI|nr:unnamed protein product [Litomosoides sigmodontis]
MNIKRVNLSARLHTNETYESYFKRRVAAVVSTYCEQQTDECITTTLRLKKENVVLLSVKSTSSEATAIGFVVTKSQRRSTLSTMRILDSDKVKYVLSKQLAALSRILGGVRIEHVEVVTMEKYRGSNNRGTIKLDNFGLLIILSSASTFLIITYTIAAVRVCRDCYAKKQAKKNGNKLNNAFEMPNYGACVEQNEISKSYDIHSTVKTSALEGTDQNNSTRGEIPVMDAYQMRRMFQCDPSQLPAEVAPSPQTSTDLHVMYASEHLSGSKSQACAPQPTQTVHQSRNEKDGRRNSVISDKISKTSQGNKSIVEVPQKDANVLATNKEAVERSSHYDSNSTNYFCQPEKDFSEQQTEKLATPIHNQLMATCNQPGTIVSSNLKGPKIDELPEIIWNQPLLENESTRLTNKEMRNKSDTLTSLFSESPFDATNLHNEETINLKLRQSNQRTGRCTRTEVTSWKRVPLTNELSYHQGSESSDCFAKHAKPASVIQKSRTTHQFDNWSSESDEERGDVYHRLSEAEEEQET